MKGTIGLIVLVAAGIFIRQRLTSVMSTVTAPTSQTSNCLEMVGSTTSEEEGTTYITGSFRNNCGREIGNVTVMFKLDQAPGTFGLSQAYAYSRNVKADETREFKSALPVSKDTVYRFDGFNAF